MTSVFEHLRCGNLSAALQDTENLAPYLPFLCKILGVVEGPNRVRIVQLLQKNALATTISALLSQDLSEILADALKEQTLRKKSDTRREDTTLCSDTASNIDLVFGSHDNVDSKLRVVAAEIIYLQSQYQDNPITSHLLSYTEYKDLIAAILCILSYRLPEVFDMCEMMLMLFHLPDSSYYIHALLVNHPSRYEEVLNSLVQLFLQSKHSNFEQTIMQHLREVTSFVGDARHLVTLETISNTRKRVLLNSLLARNQELAPESILSLFSNKDSASVIDFIKNESKVFEKLIRFSDLREQLVHMISSLMNGLGERSSVPDKPKDEDSFYSSFLDDTIQEDLASSAPTINLSKTQVVHANQLLLLYLYIVNMCRLSLQLSECKELVRLMSCKPPPTFEGDLFHRLSLSLYMSCNSLNCNADVGRMIRIWLTGLHKDGCGELVLLTGMHLYSGNYEMIGPILSQTTGLNIYVSAGHAATVQTLWSQIQTEEQIVIQLASVPVTPNLSSLVPGYLPVHCLTQLITGRLPSCPPNLFTWLPEQLRNSTEPVHPVLCDLIAGCVTFLMSVRGRSISGIEESELASLLAPTTPMPCRVLAFYYLLLYRKAISDLKLKNDSLLHEYSVNLLGDAQTLLQHTRNNRQHYASIYPTFLKLLLSQFPFLCDPQQLLCEEEAAAHVSKLDTNSDNFSVTQYLLEIKQALEGKQESKSIYMISKMLKRNQQEIPCHLITSCIPHVVKHGFRVQCCFTKLWEKSAALAPEQTWLHTARTLINSKLTEDELWSNPLLLFQIPTEISSSPAGIRILLQMLKGYISLCSARLSDVDTRQDNKMLYVTLQNSAIVQVLLQLTHLTRPEDKAIEADYSCESSALVYNFLHDFFINNDGLSKLVCWQTFKFSQIEGLVNGVPSLHVACKFTTNLLNQASLQKQLFSVCLLSHLAVQYPIQQTLAACNEMLAWAQTGQCSIVWTVLSLESFIRIAKAFPPLVDPITRLLLHQSKLLSNSNINTIKHKMKMFSEQPEDFPDPQKQIDTTLEKIMSDILVRMRGT